MEGSCTMKFFWSDGRMEDRVVPFPPPPVYQVAKVLSVTLLDDPFGEAEKHFEVVTFKLCRLWMSQPAPFSEPDENSTWKLGLKDGFYEEVGGGR